MRAAIWNRLFVCVCNCVFNRDLTALLCEFLTVF